MDIKYIFSKNYLFDPVPPQESKLYLSLIILFSALIVSAVLLKVIKKFDKRIKNRQFYCFLVCGVLGFIYIAARYEGLSWLGSRFFLSLVLSTLVIWLLYITFWMTGYIAEKKNKKERAKRYDKYLPKSKKESIKKG